MLYARIPAEGRTLRRGIFAKNWENAVFMRFGYILWLFPWGS